ncbi:ABC transporter permease [Candidatus Enterococcus ferrettii]|uniref:Permease n=1 Tax=Candidatus Enterococcus ferrettii TaxID=2815324 RepID=A0ABV0EQX9_9ENTE|nr:ABC transporter permease [Enterococcus sp. 665A]MBO1341077.1 ABC transporter permease [Enterococcus sp. 665A]
MKLFDIIQSASSNLWRNKGRTILTIVAIFIGAFTISLTSGVNAGVNDYIDKQINGVGGEDQLMISPSTQSMGMPNNEPQEYNPEGTSNSDGDYMTDKDMTTIRGMSNISKVEPFHFLATDYVQGPNDKRLVFSAASQSDIHIDLEAGRQVSANANDYEINLAPEFVKALGFSSAKDALNKKVTLAVSSQATGKQELIEATIVGVRNVSLVQQGQSITSKALSDKIVATNEEGLPDSMKNNYTMSFATMKKNLSDKQITALKDQLEDKGYGSMTVEDEIGMIRQVVNAITGVLTMFGAIALLAASFGIINTLYMSVQDRTREIGLMKAMGMSGFKVFLTFSIEALLIGFWGGLLGIGGAVTAGHFLNELAVSTFLDGLTGFTLIQFSVPSMVIIILVIMLIAFLAGTFPANRAARLDPINALRYE